MCFISLANTRKLQIRGEMEGIFIVPLSAFVRRSGENLSVIARAGPPALLMAGSLPLLLRLLTETSFYPAPGKCWVPPPPPLLLIREHSVFVCLFVCFLLRVLLGSITKMEVGKMSAFIPIGEREETWGKGLGAGNFFFF